MKCRCVTGESRLNVGREKMLLTEFEMKQIFWGRKFKLGKIPGRKYRVKSAQTTEETEMP